MSLINAIKYTCPKKYEVETKTCSYFLWGIITSALRPVRPPLQSHVRSSCRPPVPPSLYDPSWYALPPTASCPHPLPRFSGSVSLVRSQRPSLPPSASTSLQEEVARGLSSAWPLRRLVSLRWPQRCGGRRSHWGTRAVIHLTITRSREEGPICRALLLYHPALKLPTRPNPRACKVRFWISMVHA
jgi:hypothetical protein